MLRLSDYEDIVGTKVINQILEEANPLTSKHIVHVSSAYAGGGVAGMLNSLVPLFNNIGVDTGWRFIIGTPDFFHVTKSFHNGLQGEEINLTPMKKRVHEKTNQINSTFTHIQRHDCVVVHDPQPLPMINFYKKSQPWIWRCHVDFAKPYPPLWKYLREYIVKYDRVIVSKPEYKQKLPMPQDIIYPSIDPLGPKNKWLSEQTINKYLNKFGIDRNKPIVSQVSRFDKWKDPVGVIHAFERVREKMDCQLVMLGSMASDDPEGQEMYEAVVRHSKDVPDVHIINYDSNILVNVIQRASDVVIQKSTKEGFGLTVSEALYKGTPVVAGNVGGIPMQVKNGYNGYLCNSSETCAKQVLKLLKNPKKARQMGKNGHEFVKKNFLITRHMLDYIRLFKKHVINYKPN